MDEKKPTYSRTDSILWEDEGLSFDAIGIYGFLAHNWVKFHYVAKYVRGNRVAVGTRLIMTRFDMGQRRVENAIQELVDQGYIDIMQDRGKRNWYFFRSPLFGGQGFSAGMPGKIGKVVRIK